mgnify:CR=1 FL=1
MPKIKLPVKSPHIDMTPMVDLFSLLLTFFMLTATFKTPEAAPIDSPNSVSEKKAPESDLITVLVSKDGKIFLNFDNGRDTAAKIRENVFKHIGEQYKLNITNGDVKQFNKEASFGMPANKILPWLRTENSEAKKDFQVGIPYDSLNNEFNMWIRLIRVENPNAEVAIKGDANADLKAVKRVIDILQENQVNKFNLITNLAKKEEGKDEKEANK